MPVNPKSLANLQPIKQGQLTKEQVKIRTSNGGKKSAIVKKQIKTFKEMVKYALEQEINVKGIGNVTCLEAAVVAQMDKAIKKKDTYAFATLRDTSGESIVNKSFELNTAELTDEQIAELMPEVINILKNKETKKNGTDTGQGSGQAPQ